MGEKSELSAEPSVRPSTSHFRNGRPADTGQDNGAVIQTSWIVDASMSYCIEGADHGRASKTPIADSARVSHTGQSAPPDLRRTGQLTMVDRGRVDLRCSFHITAAILFSMPMTHSLCT